MEQEDARGEGTVPLVSLHLWVKAAFPPPPTRAPAFSVLWPWNKLV